MHSTDWSRRRLTLALVGLALLAAGAAAAGTPVRATYGAQTTADEPQYLLSAVSLAEDGNLDISDELAERRWLAWHEAQLPAQTKPLSDGRHVSPHDPLLPVLLAGPVAAGGWVGAKLTLSLLAGVLAAATAWTAVRRFAISPAVALAVCGVFFCSAPLAVYGTQIYPELPAALVTLLGVAALTTPLRGRACVVLAAAVVALPWLAIKYAPVAAALAGIAFVRLLREGRRASALGLVGGLVAAGLVFLGVHLVVWEGLTAYASGDHFVGGEFTAVGSAPNYPGRARRLIGLFVDREFGLAAWQPAWLLAVPAFAVAARLRPPHWLTLAVPVGVAWLNATFVALTMHGYWFPGRQVVVVLPLVVLAIAGLADQARVWRTITLTLGVVGLWSYGWLVADGLGRRITWVVDFFEVGDPWYAVWSRALPAYRYASTATTVQHAVWGVLLVGGALLAFRLGHRARAGAGRRS
ncbi:MAG TPA: hypothetical protein VFO77_04685 [Actinoplanes sp.]|nr:hypothetical protein [Actinoplanes sp.]